MRRKLLNGKIMVVFAVLLVAFMSVGYTEEERTDASGQWRYYLDEGFATLKRSVEKPSGDLLIPDVLDGYAVGTIASAAFMNCGDVASVTLGNGVMHIGSNAFQGCGGLASVTIPDSVTIIGTKTFADCYNLTSIIIPDSVTQIGAEAFSCSGLISATIPASVTVIQRNAFDGCVELVLSVPEGSYAALYAKQNDIAHVLTSADSRGAEAGLTGAWRTAEDDEDFTTLILYPDDAFRMYRYHAQDEKTFTLEGVRIVQDGLIIVYDIRLGILDSDGAYTQTGEMGKSEYGFTLIQDGTPALRLTDDYGETVTLFPFDMDGPG